MSIMFLFLGLMYIINRISHKGKLSMCLPSEEFELADNSRGAHMKVTESSPGIGHGELILRTFI